MKRKIRMGMVGGGPGAFIGEIHRIAAQMDGHIELVCGAFSSNPEKSMSKGKELLLPEDRIYPSYKDMIEQEHQLPEDERMDFVCIVTPNHLHFDPAKLALEHGFHVMVDKPMTLSLKEAEALTELVEKTGLRFGVTYTYTGYPMVKQAREMVHAGELGKIRKIFVEYPQGWLSEDEENKGNKQAEWRVDPKKSGIAGSMGDVGTHAVNIVEYISDLKIDKICADVNSFGENRTLDDDNAILLKFNNGGSGVMIASQILTGEENSLNIRIYGEKSSIKWSHDSPNSLIVKSQNKPTQIMRTGGPGTTEISVFNQRTPAGHPEGFIEAFANIYRNFSLVLQADLEGKKPKPEWLDFPDVHEGARGMLFLEKVIASGKSDQKWISV